ncbi:TrbC family F-type conjugative pilus assembly protein [Nitrospira sp. Kam-Ns4a]
MSVSLSGLLGAGDGGFAGETRSLQDEVAAVAAQGRRLMEQAAAGGGPATRIPEMPGNPSGPHEPSAGWYLVLSWSLPEAVREDAMTEAARCGVTVVLNGLIGETLNSTLAAVYAVVEDDLTRLPHTILDPIRVRRWQVTQAPALVWAKGRDALLVVQGGPTRLMDQFQALAEREPTVAPWARWCRQGGRTTSHPVPPPPQPAAPQRYQFAPPGWPLQERALDEEIKDRVARVDWATLAAQGRARVEAALQAGPGLTRPVATTARTVWHDPSATLTQPLPLPDGRTLGVAGQRLTPLAQATLPYRYVILDGTDAAQRAAVQQWLRTAEAGPPVRLLLTAGDVRQVARALGLSRAYWANEPFLAALGVERIPSVVTQVGARLRITELPIAPARATDARTSRSGHTTTSDNQTISPGRSPAPGPGGGSATWLKPERKSAHAP